MEKINILRTKSHDFKPIKILLEVILNRKNVTYTAPVRMSNLNSTFSSLNSSKDAEDILNATINEKNSDPFKATPRKKKRKTVEIKIKLDISDISEDKEHVNDEDEEEIADFKAITIKKIASKISLNAKEAKLVCENKEQVFSTAMKRMSSRVSLSIKDDNKQIENHEETLYFDINPQSDEKSNIATLIESLSGSNNHSVWHKIFEKIHNSYQTAGDDKKIVDIINELIMEKYKQALNILKERVEKREQHKTNKTNDSSDFCEHEKTFEDFKVNLESRDGPKLKNTNLKQRLEKREQNKTNKTNDSNDFCEQEKTFEDFKVNLETKEGSKLKNTNLKQRLEKREQNKTNKTNDSNDFCEQENTLEDFKVNLESTNSVQNNVASQKIDRPCRNLLDISNDKLTNDFKAYNDKYLPKYQFLNATKIDNPVPEKQFSFYKEKSFSEDLLISFENDLKRENVRSFLKAEGNNMYEDISKIFESEISLDEDIVEYDSRKFLRSALGEDIYSSFDSQIDYRTGLYDSPTLETPDTLKTEQSIGSSNISDLISDVDRRKSAGIYSLYSTVKKNIRKKHKNQGKHFAKSTKSSNDYGYESLDDLDNRDNNDHEITLTKDNVRQNEIIYQMSKAVSVCRSHSDFFGSDIFVEAEKILLIASLRKDVNEDELKKLDYEDIDQRLTSSSVIIKNIEIISKPNTIATKNKNCDWHWVCIIRHGSTVYATKPLLQDDKTIRFPDKFHFEWLPSDFEIYVSIYGLMLKNKKNKKKSRTELKTVPISSSDSTQSYFTLWGSTMIKPSQSNQTVFHLVQALPGAPITDILKIDVETTFSIHVKEVGFLTIGLDYKGYPVWNRRWCSLDGSRLRYWNYPNEEQHCEPLGELDLLHCFSKEIQRAPKDICPYRRTLLIHMNAREGNKSVEKRYFVAADNLADLERWQESLNLVLSYLRKWNDYDCFLEN